MIINYTAAELQTEFSDVDQVTFDVPDFLKVILDIPSGSTATINLDSSEERLLHQLRTDIA